MKTYRTRRDPCNHLLRLRLRLRSWGRGWPLALVLLIAGCTAEVDYGSPEGAEEAAAGEMSEAPPFDAGAGVPADAISDAGDPPPLEGFPLAPAGPEVVQAPVTAPPETIGAPEESGPGAAPPPPTGGFDDLFADVPAARAVADPAPRAADDPGVADLPPPTPAALPVAAPGEEAWRAAPDREVEAPPTETVSVTEAPAEPPELPEAPFDVDNTRRLSWRLGGELSAAVLPKPGGTVAATADDWRLAALAELLGVTPPEAGPADDAAAAVATLLGKARGLGGELASRHGADHAALFEVAVKSSLLPLIYEKDPALAAAVHKAVVAAAERAGLDGAAFKPLGSLLLKSPSPARLREGVLELHKQVDAGLH